jgi:predicted small metal-binding protein
MAKVLECAKVDPSSGCKQVIRGETTEEVMQKAAEHSKGHLINSVLLDFFLLVL